MAIGFFSVYTFIYLCLEVDRIEGNTHRNFWHGILSGIDLFWNVLDRSKMMVGILVIAVGLLFASVILLVIGGEE